MGSQELALLLLLFLPLCSAQSTYYVTPTPDTSCPGEPCLSLVEYISGKAGLLNSADLTFVFLPGDHIIENSIPLGQLTSLNLFGDSASFPEVTSVIICSQPSSFTFSQISRFNISGIAFKSCGSLSDAPMKLEQVFQAEISNCLFQDGQNGALAVVDSTLTLLENKFENNSATSARGGGVYMKNCTTNVSENAFIDNSAGEGGGIYLEDSMVHFASNMFKNNIVLTSDFYFDYYNSGDSILDSHGGGVYMKDSTANVIGNIFINNSATKGGGGVYLEDSTVHFASNVFNNNVVLSSDYYYSDGGGGALAIESSHVNILDNSFANNSATSTHGGGVYMNNSTANVSGNIFMNNSATEGGGAVCLEDSMVYFTSNVFNNNVVLSSDYYYSDGGGGALAIESSHVNILDNSFTNNSATSTHGGSVCIINNSTASVSGNMFINNSASRSGGGVYLEDSIVHFASNVFKNNIVLSSDFINDGEGGGLATESSLVNISDNLFTNNIATSTHGGGVYIKNSTANISGNHFANNNAGLWGGGVFLENSTVSFNSNRFKNNTASYGGGIEVYENSIVSATNNTFTRNIAGTAGGGIDIDSGVMATFMDNILEYNQAQTKGGGFSITSTGSNVSFTLDSFISNTANKTGGGIWIIDGIINVTKSNFTGNSASYVGGGSYLESGTAYFRENMFINNSALFNGAGMYIASNTDSIECTNNTFRNNWGDGWVLFIEDRNRTSAVLSQNTFENNTGNLVYGSSKENSSVYHITPSPDTVCPNEPCLTISKFIDQANKYIALNTTLMFLPGTHTVKSGLLVENITSLKLLGNNTSVQSLPLIICDRPASLGFKYIDKLFVHSLAFDSCGDGTYAAFSVKSVSSVEISDCNFKKSSGGAVAVANCSTLLVNNNVFENNSAIVGGGLYVNKSAVMLRRNTFTNNTAELVGAGVILFDCSANYTGVTIFTNNSVSDTGREIVNNDREFRGGFLTSADAGRFSGGAMFISKSNVMFLGNISIENSSAENGGGIMVLESNLNFSNTVCIQNNTAMYGGGVYVLGSSSTISFGGLTDFVNNSAEDFGGAVYAMEDSKLNFTGMSINFINNTALNGGGLYLDRSLCFFSTTAQLYFAQNHATESGGAIYVYDSKPATYCEENLRSVSKSDCFFQVQSDEEQLNSPLDIKTMINFSNNTADDGGGDLYGGTIDKCNLPSISYRICSDYCEFQSSGDVFNRMTPKELDIASEPLQVSLCGCEHQTPHCSPSPSIYPGKTINVSVAVLGQRNGTVSTSIQTDTSGDISITELQKTQSSTKSCSNISFTILSSDFGDASLILSTDGPCSHDHSSLMIPVSVQNCPHGFTLSVETKACDCDERLTKFAGVTCDINNEMVFRPNGSKFWVGYEDDSLILHPQCPFDYCTEVEHNITVDDNHTQCNYNRIGKLCGGCSGTTSLMLGSSRCKHCSSKYLALIIPFALAGIALVLFLFVLKLTVAVGTINGLIFYANIVQVNSYIFYKPTNINIVLTIFISWLNLDLGIETCFYNGMDVYTKTWLQFVFPIYIWLLVGVIIFISHFSWKITKLLGSNPIAVLATLFLISYAKILNTIIAALSLRYLEYPNKKVPVWSRDGDMEYFSGKHTPLFIIALLSLIFLFLPFTLLLFLGHWIRKLQSRSHWRTLLWINKPTFRAFLDAYHAPYANSHRYWTGLLLLVRCILFTILESTGNTMADLFAISIAGTGLITFALVTSGIYRNRYFGILETSFFINLVLLTTATSLVKASGDNQAIGDKQAAVTSISLSIAFITFAGIVIYHIYLQIRGTKLQGMVASQAKIYNTRLSISKKSSDIELVEKEEKISSNEASITSSYVELREPLLDEN